MKLPYPKKNANQEVYIKVPQEVDGKFFAVNVTEKGQTIPSPVYKPFEGRYSCQTHCNIHNEFHHWGKAQVEEILKQVGYEES